MKLDEVITFLNNTFHPEYQESYDNAGFLLGCRDAEYRGALVAVDLTMEVIDECIENNLGLIVTHHPFIFGGIKRITTDNLTGRMIRRLIENDIAVYAAHTNLDNLTDGVNGILAQKLGLQQCSILQPKDGMPDVGAGMVGILPQPMAIEDFSDMLKRVLGIPALRVSRCAMRRKIKKVAICGGAGGFLLGDAIHAGADVLVTSDLKYHDFQQCEDRIWLVDAGHYETEQFAKEIIYFAILQNFGTFACLVSTKKNSYVSYM